MVSQNPAQQFRIEFSLFLQRFHLREVLGPACLEGNRIEGTQA